ncbi:hypothetical protein ACWGB8_01650 [Kitasatospora sp. NPDC054939]
MHPALPIELPAEPRRFRVHKDGYEPQDCTLHPDGRMSRELFGQALWSMLSLGDMLEMNWENAEIEWDPERVEPPAAVALGTQLDLLAAGEGR